MPEYCNIKFLNLSMISFLIIRDYDKNKGRSQILPLFSAIIFN